MPMDVGLRAVLQPEFDERETEKEVGDLQDRLESLEEVDVDFDGDTTGLEKQLEGLSADTGISDAVSGTMGREQGGRTLPATGQGDGGILDTLTGAAAGSDFMTGPGKGGLAGAMGGGATGGALGGAAAAGGGALMGVALGGAVSIGILKGVQEMASFAPRGAKMLDMFSTAMQLFFRPFGDLIGSALMPYAEGALRAMSKFNRIYREEGLMVAISWMADSIIEKIATPEGLVTAIAGLGGAAAGGAAGAKVGATLGGMVGGPMGAMIGGGIGLGAGALLGGAGGGILGNLSADKITDALEDLPGTFDNIQSKVDDAASGLKTDIESAASGLATDIENAASGLADFAENFDVEAFIDDAQEVFYGAIELGQWIFEGAVGLGQWLFEGTIAIGQWIFDGAVAIGEYIIGELSWSDIKWAGELAWDAIVWSKSIAWDAIKWSGSVKWDFIKWTGSVGWDLIKWTGSIPWKFIDWAGSIEWSDIKWTGNLAWEAIKWYGGIYWSAIKWLGTLQWDIIAWGGSIAWEKISWAGAIAWGAITWIGSISWDAINFIGKIDITDYISFGGAQADPSRDTGSGSDTRVLGPGLASGGIVNRPTQALIGEGGQEEAVMPLSRLEAMLSQERSAGMREAQIGRETLQNNTRDEGLASVEDRLDELIRAVQGISGETRVEIDGRNLVSAIREADKNYGESREINK